MNYIECKTLRFDNQIRVENGVVIGDNEKGRNGLVILNDGRKYFEVVDKPAILDIFKGTSPFTLEDLNFCVFETRPTDNCVIDVVLKNSYLYYTIDGKRMSFNYCGHNCYNSLGLDEALVKYVNCTIGQVIKITQDESTFTISNVFTDFVYGQVKNGISDGYCYYLEEILNDMVYENDHLSISMTKVGIEEFYNVLINDIKENSTVVDKSISSYDDLEKYLRICNNVYLFDSDNCEDVKAINVYALYDKVELKGKETLVPYENSNLVGYILNFRTKKFFGCPPCGGGYVTIRENLFVENLDNVTKAFGDKVKVKPFRKKNLTSQHYTLQRGNSIDEPNVYYCSLSGEKIEFLSENAYYSFESSK